jgi:hypothetical protein
MSQRKEGDRVGAIRGTHEENGTEIVDFYGYGVYLGDHSMPDAGSDVPRPAGFMGNMLVQAKEEDGIDVKNPLIRLDDGSYVWGCECWWGSEERVRSTLEGRTQRNVDINAVRKRISEEHS